jgi:hypothetical protein
MGMEMDKEECAIRDTYSHCTVTADLLWAYQTHPRGTIAPSAPQLVVDRTLHSDRVKRAIEQLSKVTDHERHCCSGCLVDGGWAQEHGTAVEQLKGEARQIIDQMAGQLYGPVLRTLAYFFRKATSLFCCFVFTPRSSVL